MDRSKLYVCIVMTICLIVMAICLQFLLKNGNYSTILSAFIPIAIIVIYFISKKRDNNNDND